MTLEQIVAQVREALGSNPVIGNLFIAFDV